MIRTLVIALLITSPLLAQVTGLAGWNLFVDPGHSQTENMGVCGYSEAEEVLRTSLHLREILLSQTDIDTVWSSRYNDNVNISLWDRTQDANNRGAAWYHSVHSNAGAPEHNNVLLLWGQWFDGTPDPPVGGQGMSNIMIDLLADVMRLPSIGSRGDCGFYTWSDYCENNPTVPYLYVNRNTNMPSELSEQGHHSNPLHNQLQMNEEYKRLIAYSMFWTILDKFDIDRPYPGILAGLITDSETGVRVNGATVEIMGRTYTTDTYASLFNQYTADPDEYHNGFYFFEDLPNEEMEMIVTAEGYYPDTLTINSLSPNFASFQDVQLIPNTSPVVVFSNPLDGEVNHPAWEIPYFDFSRSMEVSTVEEAFSIEPFIEGSIYATADHKRFAYVIDDTLEFLTDYTITVAGSATDHFGHPLDGNGDGVGGDDWVLQFSTSPPDVSAPYITSISPGDGTADLDLNPVFNIVWNEELDDASILDDGIKLERIADLHVVSTLREHYIIDEKSVLVIYALEELHDNEAYRIRIFPGITDIFGNEQTQGTLVSYTTADYEYNITSIDNFEANLGTNWWQPSVSGSTHGTISEATSMSGSTVSAENVGSSNSMHLSYGWNESAGAWLIREYLATGAPRNVHFNSSKIMQAFVFGDGNGNRFRFCVDDDIYGSSAHEVSPWYTIDWYGWKLVSWDMTADGTGAWIGDGNLDGTLEFDSIQLTYTPGQPNIGDYYIDELRVVNRNYLALGDEADSHPVEYALLPNYPNPFNPWTSIPFTLPARADVSVKVYNLRGEEIALLLQGNLDAGRHVTRWNASDAPAGIYLVTLITDDISITRKVTVLK